MVRQILQMNDPILNTKCKLVTEFGGDYLQNLVDDLLDTCKEKEAISAGLSAPQIGVSLQVCVCRRMDLEDLSEQPIPPENLWEVVINPKIIKTSNVYSTYWEGCLSVGEGPNGLYGPVERPDSIEIEYQDILGNKNHLKCKGFFAHIVQHEYDHLNGIIFLKYVTNPSDIWLSKDLDEYYQKHNEYPPI